MTAPTPAPEYGELIRRLEVAERKPWGPPEECDYNDVPIHAIGPEAARAIRDLEAENARKDAAFGEIKQRLQGPSFNMGYDIAVIVSRAALSGRGGG